MRHLQDFLLEIEHARTVSEHTVRAYRSDLLRFSNQLSPLEREDPTSLRPGDIKTYIAGMVDAGLGRATIARHAAALRQFYGYLVAEGLTKENPAQALRLPKRPRSLPKVLSDEQMKRLLGAPRGQTFLPVRDRALLEVLYSAGLRVSEAVGLELEAIDLSQGVCRVLGKGRRERIAYLGSFALDALEAYLPARNLRVKDRDDRHVFLNHRGTPLTDRSVRRILDRYIILAGLPAGVSPHTLRHSFATHLLTHGASLKEVQEMLGHKHLSSTQIYTHIAPSHLKKVYELAHPLAARGKANQASKSSM